MSETNVPKFWSHTDRQLSLETRAFRQSTGIPPHRWLIERRVDRAEALLSAGGLNLAEIALACGFADQRHLTAAFCRGTGLTPGAYRREARA